MLKRVSVTSIIFLASMFLVCMTVYGYELKKSDENKEPLITQSMQHDEQKDNAAHSYNGSSCHHKKNGNIKKHKSSRYMSRGKHSYAYMVTMYADKLDLSDAQLGRLIRLHKKHSHEHKEVKKKIRKNMMKLHYAGMKPGTDTAFLRKLGDDHLDIFKAMLEQHIRNREVVNTILTVEQKNKLKSMKISNSNHSCQHSSA